MSQGFLRLSVLPGTRDRAWGEWLPTNSQYQLEIMLPLKLGCSFATMLPVFLFPTKFDYKLRTLISLAQSNTAAGVPFATLNVIVRVQPHGSSANQADGEDGNEHEEHPYHQRGVPLRREREPIQVPYSGHEVFPEGHESSHRQGYER
jgi:hypothetical protein